MALLGGGANGGKALRFNTATSDLVDVPTNPELTDLQRLTVCASHVRPNATTGGRRIISKFGGSGTAWSITKEGTGGNLSWLLAGTSGPNRQEWVTNDAPMVDLGRWYFVAATADWGVASHIYVGSDILPARESTYGATNVGGTQVNDTGGSTFIGNISAASAAYTGDIGGLVCVYNRVLSLEEIRRVQLGYWDQPGLVQAHDVAAHGRGFVPEITGRGLHGVITGAVAVEGLPSRRWWTGAEWFGRTAGSALLAIRDETENASEASLRNLGMVRLRAETENASEGTLRNLGLVRLAAETVNMAEALLARLGMVRIAAEVVNASETLVRVLGLVRLRNEAVNAAEAVLSVLGFIRVRDETAEGSEGTLRFLGFIRIANEVAEASEAVLSRLGFIRLHAETVEASEARLRFLGFVRLRGETVEVSEATLRVMGFRRIRNETERASESPLRLVAYIRTRDETVTATEATLRLLGFIRIQGETVQVSEAVAPFRGFVVIRNETVTVIEGVLGVMAATLAGFLLSAISLVPMLRGRVELGPTVQGTPDIRPAVRGRTDLHRGGSS